eukprot:7061029-Alexandrium_andersonii.AAC.1
MAKWWYDECDAVTGGGDCHLSISIRPMRVCNTSTNADISTQPLPQPSPPCPQTLSAEPQARSVCP